MRTGLQYVTNVLLLLFPTVLFAGNSQHSIKWQAPYEKRISEETTIKTLSFEGASYNEVMLPVYVVQEQLDKNVTAISAQLQNIITEQLTDLSAIKNLSVVGPDFKVTA